MIAALVLSGALMLPLAACGSDSESVRKLDPSEVSGLLHDVPYEVVYVKKVPAPSGATSATAARYIGPHGAKLEVTVTTADGELADPAPLPTPERHDALYYTDAGYTFNMSDGALPNESEAQYDAHIKMANEIDQKLCRYTTGKPCPV